MGADRRKRQPPHRKDLPKHTREGDHVVYTCTGAQLIPATEAEREAIRARMNSLFKKRR